MTVIIGRPTEVAPLGGDSSTSAPEADVDVIDGHVVMSGEVTSGDRAARLVGYPTANLMVPPGLPVLDGVWAGYCRVGDVRRAAVVTIGGDRADRSVTAHLLDYRGELRGKRMTVMLGRMLRVHRRADTVEARLRQFQNDVEATRRWSVGFVRSGRAASSASRPSFDETLLMRRWLRERRIVAAAQLAAGTGNLTHAAVARLAAVPLGLVTWAYPRQSDLVALASARHG